MTNETADPLRVEMENNLRYEMCFGLMQRRFYGRLRGLFTALQFVAGSAAFASMVAQHPDVTGWAGLLMAVVMALDIVVAPGDKITQIEAQRTAAVHLYAESAELDPRTLQKRWVALQAADVPQITSLALPAERRTLSELGYPVPTTPMPMLSRLMAALV
ncbi:hypothetical protein [Niveibacterium sp. SC-1]|uniref:hypothetical protein n=1 Tax=Niveibacterium sp. SC-1 TaxID=3135646 RepID=UPI00311D9438